jgi:hypothetical protein
MAWLSSFASAAPFLLQPCTVSGLVCDICRKLHGAYSLIKSGKRPKRK